MKQWMRTFLIATSVVGALALIPGGIVLADQASTSGAASARSSWGHHPGGLIDAALKLESLTPAQRATIEPLRAERTAATTPAREAHSQLLTALAAQVEQAKIDEAALAPSLNAVETADLTAGAELRGLVTRLHAALTPAQRSELVDEIEAGHRRGPGHGRHGPGDGGGHEGPAWGGDRLGLTAAQKAQVAVALRAAVGDGGAEGRPGGERARGQGGPLGERAKALESFRGDAFDASNLEPPMPHGKFVVKLAEAMLPILSPAQRSMLAQELRERADHPKPF
jgi:Spy/CpxP family protein refolding chaperone